LSFLLDTCVLSQAIKSAVDESAASWLRVTPPEEQFASVLSLAEIMIGIIRLPQGKRRLGLEVWYDTVLRPSFHDRVIVFDENCATTWATMRVREPNTKFVDSQIAATALTHGMTLVTRNVRDFSFPGLAVFNPWSK
jgi:predicted nucleic acid-binding protein